jgi:hypothetical protein
MSRKRNDTEKFKKDMLSYNEVKALLAKQYQEGNNLEMSKEFQQKQNQDSNNQPNSEIPS